MKQIETKIRRNDPAFTANRERMQRLIERAQKGDPIY